MVCRRGGRCSLDDVLVEVRCIVTAHTHMLTPLSRCGRCSLDAVLEILLLLMLPLLLVSLLRIVTLLPVIGRLCVRLT